MIVHNEASYLIFFVLLAGRPVTGDRRSLKASFNHYLASYYFITRIKVDMH